MLGLKVLVAAGFGLLYAHSSGAVMVQSSGCEKPNSLHVVPGHSTKLHLETSDGNRTYLLHLPSTYRDNSTPAGVIFSFHGKGETLEHHQTVSRFSDPAVNADMIAVYPEGKDRMLVQIHQLSEYLQSVLCVDKTRVYAAGKSDGGGFAARVLACHAKTAKDFASFASVAGACSTSSDDCDPEHCNIKCKPGRKNVPLLAIHGDQDKTIPFEGGPRKNRCLPSIPHFMRAWAQRDGFTASNVSTSLSAGAVEKYEFGPPGAMQDTVTLYAIRGLGHVWPSTTGNKEGPATDIDASTLIMEFFDSHNLEGGVAKVRTPAAFTALRSSVHTGLPGSNCVLHTYGPNASITSDQRRQFEWTVGGLAIVLDRLAEYSCWTSVDHHHRSRVDCMYLRHVGPVSVVIDKYVYGNMYRQRGSTIAILIPDSVPRIEPNISRLPGVALGLRNSVRLGKRVYCGPGTTARSVEMDDSKMHYPHRLAADVTCFTPNPRPSIAVYDGYPCRLSRAVKTQKQVVMPRMQQWLSFNSGPSAGRTPDCWLHISRVTIHGRKRRYLLAHFHRSGWFIAFGSGITTVASAKLFTDQGYVGGRSRPLTLWQRKDKGNGRGLGPQKPTQLASMYLLLARLETLLCVADLLVGTLAAGVACGSGAHNSFGLLPSRSWTPG
nr:putative feruloyl esterase c [Quercus suber]